MKIPGLVLDEDDEDQRQPISLNSPSSENLCGICRKTAARYRCPRCQLSYCSSACYRNEIHNDCSETFYRDHVLEAMHTTASSDDQRREMIALLKKHEEQNGENDFCAELSQMEAEEQMMELLEERFRHVNWEEESFESLWERLPESEQKTFRRLLDDKMEVTRLIQESIPIKDPWWLTTESGEDSLIVEIDGSVPPSVPKVISRPGLRYNLLDILLTYIYLHRTFSGDLHHHLRLHPEMTMNILSSLSAILPKKTTLIYDSADEVIRTTSQKIITSPTFGSPVLLSPPTRQCQTPAILVTETDDGATPSSLTETLASDISQIVHSRTNIQKALSEFQESLPPSPLFLSVRKKIQFYCAQVDQWSASLLNDLQNEVSFVRDCIVEEEASFRRDEKLVTNMLSQRKEKKALITEIS